MPSRRSSDAGFTLLEAIVALALLAGAGTALFGWINQNLAAAARLRDAQQEAALSLSAQALLAQLDPASRPEGAIDTPALRVAWRSEVLQPMRDGTGFVAGQPSNWRMGLYRTQVEAEDRATGAHVRFTVVKLAKQPRAGVLPIHER